MSNTTAVIDSTQFPSIKFGQLDVDQVEEAAAKASVRVSDESGIHRLWGGRPALFPVFWDSRSQPSTFTTRGSS
jgi:hypothetical protein